MKRLFPFVCVVAIGLGGCGRSTWSGPVPADPEAAVRSFMAAVQANSLVAMSELWGGRRGPAVSYMDVEELQKRLTVIQTYLEHERYEILRVNEPRLDDRPNQRTIEIRLSRKGCTPVVPITVIRYRAGWLVYDIDLGAAGNPARRCLWRRTG